ncbi:IS66 family insertion sequence element accessory protein TnpA [Edaphobacter modestus]|uniref:IS66 family insertion sequence element accessory protein TnpA n=1 Tax=Edaphobacter modestus TaxID=388466 RepID=UPI00102B87CF|nr:transposase [Edaphobacter modestus]
MPHDSYGMGQHNEEDLARWRGLVSEQVASGTSVAVFCRDHGLRDWQFYEWKKRLRCSAAAPFIAVEVASTEAASAQPEQMSGIEIRHGHLVAAENDPLDVAEVECGLHSRFRLGTESRGFVPNPLKQAV